MLVGLIVTLVVTACGQTQTNVDTQGQSPAAVGIETQLLAEHSNSSWAKLEQSPFAGVIMEELVPGGCPITRFESCLPGVDQFTCYDFPTKESCQRRFCPSNCSGHGDCNLMHCACESGFSGHFCGKTLCPEDCSGHGECLSDSGRCICQESYWGASCNQRQCSYNCSGNGECDFSTGKCYCFHGFSGDACSGEPSKIYLQSDGLVFALALFVVAALAIYAINTTKLRMLPDSIVTIFVGVLIGGILRLSEPLGFKAQWVVWIPPNTIFLYILPLIIFESGFSIDHERFFKNIGTILVFAVLGTILAVMSIAGGMVLLGNAHIIPQLPVRDAAMFAALLSAVDPVATLTIFKALKVDSTLYMLVLGESTLNDAVAIVIFQQLLDVLYYAEKMPSNPLLYLSLRFVLVFGISVTIGALIAASSALIFKALKMRDLETPMLEIVLTFSFAYISYVVAEALHMSGIMSTLFCGIGMAHYTLYNLTPTAQIVCEHMFRVLSFLSETFLFAYLGLSVYTTEFGYSAKLIGATIILCLVGRLWVFPLAAGCNQFRSSNKINLKNQFVMWFSGLRGGIAFALALNVPGVNGGLLASTTLFVVIFTIVAFGGLTAPILRLLSATPTEAVRASKAHHPEFYRAEGKLLHLGMTEEDADDDGVSGGIVAEFDDKYLIPFLRLHGEQEGGDDEYESFNRASHRGSLRSDDGNEIAHHWISPVN